MGFTPVIIIRRDQLKQAILKKADQVWLQDDLTREERAIKELRSLLRGYEESGFHTKISGIDLCVYPGGEVTDRNQAIREILTEWGVEYAIDN